MYHVTIALVYGVLHNLSATMSHLVCCQHDIHGHKMTKGSVRGGSCGMKGHSQWKTTEWETRSWCGKMDARAARPNMHDDAIFGGYAQPTTIWRNFCTNNLNRILKILPIFHNFAQIFDIASTMYACCAHTITYACTFMVFGIFYRLVNGNSFCSIPEFNWRIRSALGLGRNVPDASWWQ